ncbi:hypothetical protein ES703_103551 [subsurface metagenome]
MIACMTMGWMAFAIVLLFLIVVLLAGRLKIENLEKRNRDLMDEKSKLSDQVRIKGIAVDRLTKEVKRLEKEGG